MIQLTKEQLDQIGTEAVLAYPAECCGLLVGEKDHDTHTLKRIVPSINLLKNQDNNYFEINPQTRINVERELRNTTEHIIGHFHSHPDQPATPSKTDIKMAYEPELIWLIVAVSKGKVKNISAYQLNALTSKITNVKYEITK